MKREDEVAAMQRELVHDLGQAVRDARAQAAAVQTTAWARDQSWTHPPSDDFEGCTE